MSSTLELIAHLGLLVITRSIIVADVFVTLKGSLLTTESSNCDKID